MRGGSIRYQAKNLGSLRLPPRKTITATEERKIVAASRAGDFAQLDHYVDALVNRCLDDIPSYPQRQPEQLLLAMEEKERYDKEKSP